MEYNDADYINKVPLTPKVSMLPLTKEQVASKECVGSYESRHKGIRKWANGRPQNTEGPFELLENNPTEDRPSESVEETSPRPPLIMVMGRSWSPERGGNLGFSCIPEFSQNISTRSCFSWMSIVLIPTVRNLTKDRCDFFQRESHQRVFHDSCSFSWIT